MGIDHPTSSRIEAVRDDYIPASDYFSQEFAELENERLWPHVWQMACREEDIPNVGDFYTYDILDDSIIVIRTSADEIQAFHNVCAHRGRRLTSGCGHTTKFQCRFHGWQYDLDGRPLEVVDREDWGDKLKDEDISLMPVKVGRWGGWVYINQDPQSESLGEHLATVKDVLDPLDLDGLRYHWKKSAIVPCNWKTILGFFNEGYHLQQTHRQMLAYWDDVTTSRAEGRHGMFEYVDTLPPGLPSRRLNKPAEESDMRAGLAAWVDDMVVTLKATDSLMMTHAAKRLMTEVPADAAPEQVMAKLGQFTAEEAISKGIQYPPVTPEQMQKIGADWHVFPNQILISGPLSCLNYRVRPNGHDPDSAIWDVYSLLRYPPGEEPKPEHEWCNDLTDEAAWPKILRQDFENILDVQKGMKSRGFRGCRPSPKQELPVSNLHRALREFMQI